MIGQRRGKTHDLIRMESFASFVTRAGDGIPQGLLESAWRASGHRVETALSILQVVRQQKKPTVPPIKPPLRPTSVQPKLSFAASVASARIQTAPRTSAAPPHSDQELAGSAITGRQAGLAVECIDLLSSSEDEDEINGCRAAVRQGGIDEVGSRAVTNVSVAPWPKELPLLSVLCPCLVKGAYPDVTPATPLAVWHEVATSSAAGTKRSRTASAFTDRFADVDAAFSSTNVRFGLAPTSAPLLPQQRQGSTALGRLPPELSRWLAPLLDHRLASAVCRVPFRPALLSIAITLDVDVVITIHESAQRLLQGQARASIPEVTSLVTGSIVSPLDKALMQALFEVCFYCTHGRPPAQPSSVAADVACGPAADVPSASIAPASTDAAGAEEGTAAAADNAEERVSEGEAFALQTALEQVRGSLRLLLRLHIGCDLHTRLLFGVFSCAGPATTSGSPA
jgi:hypothetical protein